MSTFSLVIGILITIALLMPVQAQEDGLVAEWHFDKGSGNVVKDSSGNGNDGTIYGATWVDGKFGKALSFDGVDDYVEVPDSPSLNPTEQITIEAWYKPLSFVGAGNEPIVDKSFTSHNPPYYQYMLGVTGDGYKNSPASFVFYITTNNNWKYTRSEPGIWKTGQWYHIIGLYDGTSMELYVNGNLISSTPGSGKINNYGMKLRIGSYVNFNAFLRGTIDEIRIYNRALSPEEVKQHYEQGPTALSLTKSASPQSIKQGQTSTISLTVKNTGSTELKDFEISDTIPTGLTFVEGETSKKYASLSPKDSRQFQYTVQIDEAGTFNLNPAIATYADDKGNYHTIKSKPGSIEVIATIFENSPPTPKPTNGNVQSASVNLHGEKTDVALGENVLLKLSAVNIIGNPTMHVQVIIIPPNGWSVTSSEFSKSGAGQYTTMYDLKPEDGSRDIEVKIMPNQIGDNFEVKGRIIYYFGDDLTTREDHTLNLPIKVRAVVNTQTPTPILQLQGLA